MKTPQGEAVASATGNIPGILEEVKTLLCGLGDKLIVGDNLQEIFLTRRSIYGLRLHDSDFNA